jgi:hypothetical protein
MQALDSFSVIEGKVGLSAEAMRALIMDNGHQFILNDLSDEQGNVTSIRVECHRKDWPADKWATYAFSMVDARIAGLLAPSRSGKPTAWQKYPRAMLDARATSGAARRYFADVLAGMSYTPEEIRDFSGDDREEQPSQPPAPPPAVPEQPPTTITSGDHPATEALVDSVPQDSSPSSSQSSPPKAPRTRKPKEEPSESASVPTTTPDSETAPSAASTGAGSDVRLEMRKGLTAVIAGLDPMQQPLVRAYLAQQGYGDITKLDEAKITEAINIAAGWPDTCIVDAEVVDEQALMDEPEQQSF